MRHIIFVSHSAETELNCAIIDAGFDDAGQLTLKAQKALLKKFGHPQKFHSAFVVEADVLDFLNNNFSGLETVEFDTAFA
jgi:hypothetical protein